MKGGLRQKQDCQRESREGKTFIYRALRGGKGVKKGIGCRGRGILKEGRQTIRVGKSKRKKGGWQNEKRPKGKTLEKPLRQKARLCRKKK